MQKSRNYILLIEFVLGGKRESVDTGKLAVRPVLDELFNGASPVSASPIVAKH